MGRNEYMIEDRFGRLEGCAGVFRKLSLLSEYPNGDIDGFPVFWPFARAIV